LRLTSEELAELDARATREHKTRSELIREALSAMPRERPRPLKHGISAEDAIQAASWGQDVADLAGVATARVPAPVSDDRIRLRSSASRRGSRDGR
jgi:hypothetical protein